MLRMSEQVTILVFEDSRLDAELLKVILTMGPYTVEFIKDGKEASEYISKNSPPDIVLTDVNLPQVNGVELVKQMKSNNSWKTIPIIALSASLNLKNVKSIKEAGVSSIIAKPFQPERLQKEIFRLTGYERIE